jgi:hypothetical protein
MQVAFKEIIFMITLIKIFLGNVAGVVGDIVILDWNRQTVTKAKSEGLNSPALSYVRSFGIFALSVPATWAAQQSFVYIFTEVKRKELSATVNLPFGGGEIITYTIAHRRAP